MEQATTIANFFIKKSQETGKDLTPMKLVKLLYISQGWYLALNGEQLLSESVEAWKYGPVIPSVYHRFKQYGNSQITSCASIFNSEKGGIFIPQVTDEFLLGFLEKIWDLYSNFSGVQLSTMTHMEGTPWYKTWYNNGGKDGQNIAIPNNLIKEHYLAKISSGNNDAAH